MPSQNKPKYIDEREVYALTNQGIDIFQHLFPGVDLSNPKKHFKIRADEKTPSAAVSWFGGFARITDYGDRQNVNSLKAVPYLMKHMGLDYYNALVYIQDVIIRRDIGSDGFRATKWAPEYEKLQPEPGDKAGQYNFTFKEKPTETDLASIGRYVTAEILRKYNGKSVAEYTYVQNKDGKLIKHRFAATEDYPIFLFDYGDFQKIYKPHEQKKKYRFVFVGQKPADYIFGLDQVKNAPNEFITAGEEETVSEPPSYKPNAIVKDLFRCTGESDALNLASLGYHVYWLGSETVNLNWSRFREIDDLCESHYQIMDLDSTGKQAALDNALKFYTLYTIELPKWLTERKDWRGNPCKDLKDFINTAGDKKEATEYAFSVLKANARRVKFWDKIVEKKKVNYNINMEFFYFFLKANGFYQMESIYHKKAGYCYVHIQGKVAYLIHPDNIKRIIKRFTKEWIQKKQIKEGIKLLNKINTSTQISEANLETIEETALEFRNHDARNEYIHFSNGSSLHISPDEIKQVPHDKVPNFILGSLEVNKNTISHLCQHEIRITKPPIEVQPSAKLKALLEKLHAAKNSNEREYLNYEISRIEEIDRYEIIINDPDFIFVQFLQDLSRIHWRKELEHETELSDIDIKEQNLVLANLLFILGYHCQQYKDPGKPWLTFLQDMKISEVGEASGRSGKSLLSKAPTYVRASFYKGGRSLDDKSAFQFFYDGYTEFHDYIEVDDLAEYADMGWFYTQITGNREVNPKNYAPFTLDYRDSGKMLISSNYELPNVNSSTIARMLNAGVSDYYHEKTRYNDYKETRTPFAKFGRLLYDDFTHDEWNKFYNLMAYCIQMNMRFNKIQPPMLNIEKRQARRAMTQGLGKDEVFLHWANDYFVPYTGKPEDRPEVSPEDAGYLNTLIIKDVAFEQFCIRLSKKQKSDYRITKFKRHVEAFCDYYAYEFNPSHLSDSNGRILKTLDGKTRECFYISTVKISENGHPSPPVPEHKETANDKPPF